MEQNPKEQRDTALMFFWALASLVLILAVANGNWGIAFGAGIVWGLMLRYNARQEDDDAV